MKKTGKKVFVGMSGGVDSSVAAALLKKRGYDITGVFVKGWPARNASPASNAKSVASAGWRSDAGGYPEEISCSWRGERQDAIRAAAKIGVPLLTFDFSKEYEKKVVEYMKKEYASAKTPNPDVMCNKYIKFGLFLDKALKMGADYIATGHYVNLKNVHISGCRTSISGRRTSVLLEAKDKNKDQSYFLWTLTQEQLKYCLFPIGNYTKPKVRQMARKFGLPTAEKKDSQGLCFVGDIDFAMFLRKILPKKQGEIQTPDGKIVGKHDGVHFYTIGQRHGLAVAGKSPYYVVDKDLKKNILFVAEQKDEKKFYKREAMIDETNWISGMPDLKGKPRTKTSSLRGRYLARIRYRQPLQKCRLISIAGDSATIRFDKPQRAVTSGQSLVLYRRSEMLGGGIII